MKKLLIALCGALALSACSTVVITDGEQDAIVGDGRTKDQCGVKVNENFSGTLTYHSERCDVKIESEG